MSVGYRMPTNSVIYSGQKKHTTLTAYTIPLFDIVIKREPVRLSWESKKSFSTEKLLPTKNTPQKLNISVNRIISLLNIHRTISVAVDDVIKELTQRKRRLG